MPSSGIVPTAAPTRLADDERAAVREVVDAVLTSGPLIGGPFVEAFEDAFATYLGARHCVGVGNGSDALRIAFQALECPTGRVALVPPNDGGFAAAAAQAAGLVPVAIDVHADTGLVDVALVADAWTPEVAAVVVTHLHGTTCDVQPVLAWCHQRGAVVVEDCAQAAGAIIADARVGSLGDAATFSFYPTKNLAAFGDGGAVVTDDSAVADTARSLRQYGWSEWSRIADPRGRNTRLDALQAAILTARLPYLDRNNSLRRDVVRRYRDVLSHQLVPCSDDASFVAHHARVVTEDRDGLRAILATQGVDTAVHYPYLISEMPAFRNGAARPTPNAARLRDRGLSLPCFPTLTESEISSVLTALCAWQRPDG